MSLLGFQRTIKRPDYQSAHLYCTNVFERVHGCLTSIFLQVSQLMILYEEAQGGRVTGDLSQLLEAVGLAVQNLVQVSI